MNKTNSKQHTNEMKLQQQEAQHRGYVAMLNQQLLNKLHLVGINSTGAIERSFVTDIKATYVGAVAIRLSAANIDDGLYFDMRGLTVYHTYDEKETAEWVAKYEEERAKMSRYNPQIAASNSDIRGGLDNMAGTIGAASKLTTP